MQFQLLFFCSKKLDSDGFLWGTQKNNNFLAYTPEDWRLVHLNFTYMWNDPKKKTSEATQTKQHPIFQLQRLHQIPKGFGKAGFFSSNFPPHLNFKNGDTRINSRGRRLTVCGLTPQLDQGAPWWDDDAEGTRGGMHRKIGLYIYMCIYIYVCIYAVIEKYMAVPRNWFIWILY